MKVKVCCCLLAFVLSCNSSAEIIQVKEKESVILQCRQWVKGDITWRRKSYGSQRRVNILTTTGYRVRKHIYDRGKRFSSLPDKSLFIHKVTISDSGRYFCNSEAAVELKVIPSDNKTPQKTTSTTTTTTTTTTTPTTTTPTTTTPTTTTTTTTTTTPTTTTTTPTTTTTTTPTTTTTTTPTTTPTTTTTGAKGVIHTTATSPPKTEQQHLGLVFGIVIPFLVTVIIVSIVPRRRRIERRGSEESCHIYAVIQDGLVSQPSTGSSQLTTNVYYLVQKPKTPENAEERL